MAHPDLCSKCGGGDWYVNLAGQGSCRDCRREYLREYRTRPAAKARLKENQRRYYTSPKGVAKMHRNAVALRHNKPELQLLALAHRRASKAGVPCTITHADIRAVWPADALCPALGLPLVWGLHGKGSVPEGASLDRIRPSEGYVPGNIAILSRRANAIKLDATASEILAVGQWLAEQEAPCLVH